MQRTQRLRSGQIVRQDFTEAARFVFFASDLPEFPYWTPGGTAFAIDYKARPYVVTCRHVLDKADKGDEPVITDLKFGNTPVRASCVHRVQDLDGGALDADMGDVTVLAFDCSVTVQQFHDTAYVVDENTAGSSEHGDDLLVHGALKAWSFINETEVSPHFSTFEFSDAGATSEDPFIREAVAKFADADFESLAGLSGSPVFNATRRYLCGMVVRGGMQTGICRIRYVDMFDIVRLLESIHTGDPRVTYTKTVKRQRPKA